VRNILIIGGSYFSGRVLVEELSASAEYKIHLFNRGRVPLKIDGVTEFVGDREDPNAVAENIPSLIWDAVIDFCAYEPEHIDTLLRHFKGEIKHYILISTTSVYRTVNALGLDENAPLLQSPQPELGEFADYGFHKLQTERTLTASAAQYGFEYTILRPAIIYGYYNYAPRESFFFERILAKCSLEVPEQQDARYSFIWVVDMAQAIIKCLGNERVFNQIFNLASDESVSYRQIIDCLDSAVKGGVETVKLSDREAREMGVSWPFPPDTDLVYSGEKLTECLRLTYTPFAKGLLEALKFYYRTHRAAAVSGNN